jgi:hypothetical protein
MLTIYFTFDGLLGIIHAEDDGVQVLPEGNARPSVAACFRAAPRKIIWKAEISKAPSHAAIRHLGAVATEPARPACDA